MKLILKRVEPAAEGAVFIDGGLARPSRRRLVARPLALHTEDGQLLPGQTSLNMHSVQSGPTTLTVTFTVDGDKVRIQGDKDLPSAAVMGIDCQAKGYSVGEPDYFYSPPRGDHLKGA